MLQIWKAGLALTLAVLVGSAASPARAEGARLNVVSSFSVVGDFVDRVGGDQVENHVLVGPDSDSHTYEPTPSDGLALKNATLVIQNGLNLEPWLDRLYSASGSRAERIALSENLETLRLVGEDDHDSANSDEGAEMDPHVWHDPRNAARMVEVVRDALIRTDPQNAAGYRANAEAYLAQLSDLDTWVTQQVAGIPEDRRKLVTSHDTFGYFSRRYGFEVLGSALGSVTTEVADPSAGAIADLIAEIKAAQVPAIFAENVSNPQLMDQIAAAAGVRLIPDLYTDALGQQGTPGDSYLGMMRFNVMRISEALRGS